MNIKKKLILLFSIACILGTSIIGIYSIKKVYEKTIATASHKLKSDLAIGRALIDERYSGDWSIQNG